MGPVNWMNIGTPINVSAAHRRKKKMAAVHSATIPREPYIAHKLQGKSHFCDICPCAEDSSVCWV